MKSKRNDILKIIAVTCMLLDHIALFFLAHNSLYWIMRGAGRLAFPLFAYQLVVGYKHTKSFKKYLFRLFVLALLTQPIYSMFFSGLNIIFTLILGLLLIYSYDNNYFFLIISIMLVPFIFNIEYNLFGILLPLIFYLFEGHKLYLVYVLNLIVYYSLGDFKIQGLSILALLLIQKSWKFNIRINKYFFYFFYPCHLLLLIIIYKMI